MAAAPDGLQLKAYLLIGFDFRCDFFPDKEGCDSLIKAPGGQLFEKTKAYCRRRSDDRKVVGMTKGSGRKAKAVGINHVALEVEDIDEAIEFYGKFLDFEIKSRSANLAFIYFGDQFINFTRGRRQEPDGERHIGIAVDDKDLVRETLIGMGVELIDSRFLDFLDPWGNRVEITTYTNIQFSKSPGVLRGMGLSHLEKSKEALAELRERGMAPD